LKAIQDQNPTDECLVAQSLDDPFLLLYSSVTNGNCFENKWVMRPHCWS